MRRSDCAAHNHRVDPLHRPPVARRRPVAGLAALALAMISAVVPGTVWSELSADRSMLLMHVFDVEDEAAFIAHFKSTYERPLQEIFE